MLKKLQAEAVLKMTEATSSMPRGQVLEVSASGKAHMAFKKRR